MDPYAVAETQEDQIGAAKFVLGSPQFLQSKRERENENTPLVFRSLDYRPDFLQAPAALRLRRRPRLALRTEISTRTTTTMRRRAPDRRAIARRRVEWRTRSPNSVVAIK